MEKVKLPKNIIDCIRKARKDNDSNFAIISKTKGALVTPYLLDLNEYFFSGKNSTPDIFLEALVNGYVVEETPEEKLIKVYKQYLQSTSIGSLDARLFASKAAGIRETLNILGIEIEGINKPKEEN